MWGTTKIHLFELVEQHISIHVPRVGDDSPRLAAERDVLIFLSTSPVWGTTVPVAVVTTKGRISIHVPRVGDDILRIADDRILAI